MVNAITKDRYGRTVAELYLPNGQLIQGIQAKNGQLREKSIF